jgi:hypothetical protein
MTLGSEAETSMEPTVPVFRAPSATGLQFSPPSVVFQTPPPVAPK